MTSYPIKIERKPEIPTLLAHSFPICLLDQFVVKVNTSHHFCCKKWSHSSRSKQIITNTAYARNPLNHVYNSVSTKWHTFNKRITLNVNIRSFPGHVTMSINSNQLIVGSRNEHSAAHCLTILSSKIGPTGIEWLSGSNYSWCQWASTTTAFYKNHNKNASASTVTA